MNKKFSEYIENTEELIRLAKAIFEQPGALLPTDEPPLLGKKVIALRAAIDKYECEWGIVNL